MFINDQITITGSNERKMAATLYAPEGNKKVPVIIYAHGFNGFKDWGGFNRIAQYFTDHNLALLSFNFSHNGTTPDHLIDFVDLEAFGQNNYSKQLFDLTCVIDWVVEKGRHLNASLDIEKIGLLGHSMGGGMVILKAQKDNRIRKVASWAAISHCKTPWGKWSQSMLADWKQSGVAYYENKRTAQQMPLYYQLYEDFQQHEEEFDILLAASRLQIPFLICHGLQDPAVPVESAYLLKMAQPKANIFIRDGDHVFGRRHPDEREQLPPEILAVVIETIAFFQDS